MASAPITRTIAVGPGTESAALTPDGRRVWAASMGRDSTYVFDTGTGERVVAAVHTGTPTAWPSPPTAAAR